MQCCESVTVLSIDAGVVSEEKLKNVGMFILSAAKEGRLSKIVFGVDVRSILQEEPCFRLMRDRLVQRWIIIRIS